MLENVYFQHSDFFKLAYREFFLLFMIFIFLFYIEIVHIPILKWGLCVCVYKYL